MNAQERPLTEPAFWDDFWKGVTLPSLPDETKRYDRCFVELFDRYFPKDPSKTVFEAGCAPGAWLAFLHKRYGYAPVGCETSPKGAALTRENFKQLGVPGTLLEEDLMTLKAGPFDVLISLGFIEHFDDPSPVLKKHVELMKPGALLFMDVPNLTGLNAFLVTPELLAAHNQGVMNKAYFERFASDYGLETLFLGYVGGFEPDLLGPPRSALGKRVLLRALRELRRLPGTGVDSPLWSGFLAGIFRKPAA
jgi:SAM-dependent methyltransferase